ncbi:MAG: phage minor capsid protein [Clostridia bacterium]|nr:phage minor capsid protein [Clostridia bacterium]
MMTGDELDALPRELEAVFYRLQNRITDDIVRRMRANMGEITRAADWQIYRAAELGTSKKELRRIIADTLKLADTEVDRIFDEAKNSGYARAVEVYEKTGIDVRSYADNDVLKQLVVSLKKQTLDELTNITGTLGVATANRGKRQILSLTEFYTRTMDDAALDISTGAFDYNSVLKRAVRELTNSGIRHIYYDSVSKHPTTARIEVAARRAIMTGVSQLTGKISEQNAEALGTDMYEVTAHEGCRETHLDWQGKWYSMADLVRVCGYGDVAGLKGANCRHDFYPVIPGVDEPTYTADDLARIREDELTPREYGGKEYTKYQATQRQRELERTMRARRASIKALEDGGADEDDIILERASYRALSQEYTRFSKSMGLREQRERVTIDGLGNVGAGKWKVMPKTQ